MPMLIVSAGIGEIVKQSLEFLYEEIKLRPKISIISNLGVFDENGILTKFKEPIIHSFNKSTYVKSHPLMT
jgi:hypothetical protein